MYPIYVIVVIVIFFNVTFKKEGRAAPVRCYVHSFISCAIFTLTYY